MLPDVFSQNVLPCALFQGQDSSIVISVCVPAAVIPTLTCRGYSVVRTLCNLRRLEGGEINLVAAQLHLDREHPNRLVFGPEAGLDPSLDVVLVGSELRVLIKGRASNWLNNVVITSSRTRAAASGARSAVLPRQCMKSWMRGSLCGRQRTSCVLPTGHDCQMQLSAEPCHDNRRRACCRPR